MIHPADLIWGNFFLRWINFPIRPRITLRPSFGPLQSVSNVKTELIMNGGENVELRTKTHFRGLLITMKVNVEKLAENRN